MKVERILLVLAVATVACDMEGPAVIADVGELVVPDEPILGHSSISRYSTICDYELELMEAGTIIEWTPMPGEVHAEHAWRPWWVEGESEDTLVARYSAGGPFRSPDSLVVIGGRGTNLRGHDRVFIRHTAPAEEVLAVYVYPPQTIDCKPAMGNIEYGRLVRH